MFLFTQLRLLEFGHPNEINPLFFLLILGAKRLHLDVMASSLHPNYTSCVRSLGIKGKITYQPSFLDHAITVCEPVTTFYFLFCPNKLFLFLSLNQFK